MRRPSNYAIYNKLRPSEVGLEADKPETLKDGESYFATDTYRLYYGGKKDESPFVTKGFPYYLLTKDFDGNDAFKLFVDPISGDDDNNGLSWAKAKKTIQEAIDILPLDLGGYTAWIFVKPGTYPEALVVNKNNGMIRMNWFGENWLDGDHGLKTFAVNGEPVTTTNDPIIITGTPGNTGAMIYKNGSCNLSVEAMNPAISAWSPGANFAERWVFSHSEAGAWSNLTLSSGSFTGYGIRFNMNDVKMGVECGNCECWFVSPAFYGGTGEGSTSTSSWRGALMINPAFGITINLGKYGGGFGWDANFLPKQDDGVYFEDINQVASFRNQASINLYNPTYVQVSSPYAKGIIRCNDDSENYKIEWHSDKFTLNNLSNSKMYFKDLKDNSIKNYLTANIQDPLPTSDPAIAGALWNDTGTVKVSAGP